MSDNRSDSLELLVGGRRLTQFIAYDVDADLYKAADAFSMTLGAPDMEINPGMTCKLRVNGELELTGLIDSVEETGDKSKNEVTIEGRDLGGLLVDSYVEEFPDLQDVVLKQLADQLLAKVPLINRKQIVYQAGIGGQLAQQTKTSAFDLGQKHAHCDATRTIFDTLRDYAASRGAMFFFLADGTPVFGRPKASGAADYQLIRRLSGQGNTIVSGGRTRDISQRYTPIIVLGQRQGRDQLGASEINTSAVLEDPDMPIRKPLVVQNDNDGESPAQHARLLLDRQRAGAVTFKYVVDGHSQNNLNWSINRLCRVIDETLRPAANGIYLVTGRRLKLSKEEGRTTEVRLGLPGVVA